jgi:hypothetical protein
MAILHDSGFGKKLCEILHLDPKKTVDIFISNKINDAVRVNVTQIMKEEEGNELLKVLKEYRLESIKPDENNGK